MTIRQRMIAKLCGLSAMIWFLGHNIPASSHDIGFTIANPINDAVRAYADTQHVESPTKDFSATSATPVVEAKDSALLISLPVQGLRQPIGIAMAFKAIGQKVGMTADFTMPEGLSPQEQERAQASLRDAIGGLALDLHRHVPSITAQRRYSLALEAVSLVTRPKKFAAKVRERMQLGEPALGNEAGGA